MSVVDDVKQKLDIVEVIGSYVQLSKSGRTLKGLCPFHSEKHGSFFVYPERQSWHCFGACATGGDVFAFVMKKENVEFGEALRMLAQRAGVVIPSYSEPVALKDEKDKFYQLNQSAAQYFNNLLVNSPIAEKVRQYLAGRGVSAESITDFQLGYSPPGWETLKQYFTGKGESESDLVAAGLVTESEKGKFDRFRNRLMFPIVDNRGRTLGFGARTLGDDQPKYLNSPQTPVFDKSGNLYGINFAAEAIRQKDMAVIVEGYMDVIMAHQYGIRNVVASMGTSITERQMTALKRLSKHVVLCLDPDDAGEEAMLRGVAYENMLGAEVKVMHLPAGKDPDEVIKEDVQSWQTYVSKAEPVVDYTFDRVAAALDLGSANGKALLVSRLLPIIAEIQDVARQDHYLGKLARATDTTRQKLERELLRLKSMPKKKSVAAEVAVKPAPAARKMFAQPIEDHCLALVLQHPELKPKLTSLTQEYFESSENREIFLVCQLEEDPAAAKPKLDAAIHEHFESLCGKRLLASTRKEQEDVFDDCAHRLKERFLKGLAAKRAHTFSHGAETAPTDAGLAESLAPDKEISAQLKKVFDAKSKM